MKIMSQYRYIYIILVGMLSLQACGNQSVEEKGTSTKTSPPISTALPPPSVYASNKEGWLVNIDDAYALSMKEQKPILANFTGSDWCGWCKRLDADVFTTLAFKAWAQKNVVLLEVDFPRRKQLPEKNKKQNAAMAQSLGISGYPTIWILNVTREEKNSRFKLVPVGKTGYAKTPEKFIGVLDNYIRLAKGEM
jgi:protein disulfide-isomerase